MIAYAFGWLPGDFIKEKYLIGIGLACVVLLIGGVFDDKYTLRPWQLIIWPVLASLIIVASGIGIRSITNPFGGLLSCRSFLLMCCV